ncbi:MAG: GNAT family N-acetyltransferase, partial [Candidatus Izemoplasmataceae bacterium]
MIKEVLLEEEKNQVKAFLKTFDLLYEDDIDYTVMIIEEGRLIATASKSQNIIKCVAINPLHQGKNLLSTLMTALIKKLAEENIHHYFLYTLNQQAPLFKALGLNEIVKSPNVTLFEGGAYIKNQLETLKKRYQVSDHLKACLIINANPMTKGHFHLIKHAASLHEEILVFIVSEDRSFFPFDARFEIIKKACEGLPNVKVLPTLNYLVSSATFPKY